MHGGPHPKIQLELAEGVYGRILTKKFFDKIYVIRHSF